MITLNNIFYNIASILIGLGLIYYGISNLKKSKLLLGVLTLIHCALFLFFGIFGFFLPENYESISVLAMLAFCITMVLCIMLLSKSEKKDKTTAKAKSID